MGHRALVAYERDDDRYDVHYSHWGGDLDLRRRITPETPLGGRHGGRTAIDPDPIATGLSLAEVIGERLDFLLHEALYAVDADLNVREYRVLPFVVATADGLIEGGEVAGRGALIEVSPFDPGAGYVRGWFDGVREVAGELVDSGYLPGPDALPWLEDRLRRFGGRDREVIVDPSRDGHDF